MKFYHNLRKAKAASREFQQTPHNHRQVAKVTMSKAKTKTPALKPWQIRKNEMDAKA